MPSFDRDGCSHFFRIALFGRDVELASDDPRIIELLSEAFASRHFKPRSGGHGERFVCSTRCEPPWSVAMALPGAVYLARPTAENPDVFETFWSPDGSGPLERAGFFSYDDHYGTPSEDTTLELFTSTFQRRVVGRILRDQPALRLIHAGSLECQGKGLLVLAPTKGGKSTLTLACVMAGMGFLSDDCSAVDLRDGVVHPFPRALRLRKRSLDLASSFSQLSFGTVVDVLGETRYYLHPERLRPDALGRSVPLTHIVTIRGFASSPRIEPSSAGSAVVACSGSDCFAQPSQALELMWRWSDPAGRAECFDIHVGAPGETAELLVSLMREGSRGPRVSDGPRRAAVFPSDVRGAW